MSSKEEVDSGRLQRHGCVTTDMSILAVNTRFLGGENYPVVPGQGRCCSEVCRRARVSIGDDT